MGMGQSTVVSCGTFFNGAAMGKYSTLRTYMRRFKTAQKYHVLANCPLVIEGDSFFRQTYKDSGCNFILGGEFDRYADYLRSILMNFIQSNVTCYVIINGTMKANVEKRKAIHKKIIDDRNDMKPGDDKYYEPIFMKDVYKQILEELGIKYCVTEFEACDTLLDVSKELNCPVLTNNFEQCLLGMTCITPGSLVYDGAHKQITCKIQTSDAYNDFIRIYDNMKPILLTILNENGPLYDNIPEIINCNPVMPVGPLLIWIRRQKLQPAIDKLAGILDTENERDYVRESIDGLRKTIFYNRKPNVALKYLKGEPIPNKHKYWFENGVMTDSIASPYINLKNNGIFSGSWVIFDQNKRDAILPALGIAIYGYGVLSKPQQNVTFIGREKDSVYVEKVNVTGDLFKKFIDDALLGFDWLLLDDLPEECWLLVITLVYYTSKANTKFVTAAYSILLSYVMLGPVFEKVGLIKRSKIVSLSENSDTDAQDDGICTYKDSLNAAKSMMKYFYEENFDRSVLHDLAEFQHCLQHMNYLNKLCGKRIQSTNYYRTYNGTFILSIYFRLMEYENPMIFIETHLKTDSSVVNFYQDVKNVFDMILSGIKNT